jgi:GGDEF domain-containing protein
LKIIPIVKRLLDAAHKPIEITSKTMQVSASIGVANEPSDDADKLIRHADQAMHISKQSGKNRYSLFSPTLYKML